MILIIILMIIIKKKFIQKTQISLIIKTHLHFSKIVKIMTKIHVLIHLLIALD